MKKENITDIEELIADAKAEEEVAREQAKAEKTNTFREDLKAHLVDALGDSIREKRENKITIDLYEYILLKQKATDLDRILNAIVDELELNYSKDYLRIKNGERIADTIRVLYPDVYDHLLAVELEQAENEDL